MEIKAVLDIISQLNFDKLDENNITRLTQEFVKELTKSMQSKKKAELVNYSIKSSLILFKFLSVITNTLEKQVEVIKLIEIKNDTILDLAEKCERLSKVAQTAEAKYNIEKGSNIFADNFVKSKDFLKFNKDLTELTHLLTSVQAGLDIEKLKDTGKVISSLGLFSKNEKTK